MCTDQDEGNDVRLSPGHLARTGLGQALSVVRRGPRTVLWTPDLHMGVGNHLYYWLWADRQQRLGHDALALHRDTMDQWLAEFPRMRPLVVERRQVRFTDRRAFSACQEFGVDFTAEDLSPFIRERLVDDRLAAASERTRDDVVINVRRGDYYSDLTFRGRYAFDLDAYLRLAVSALAEADAPARLVVVSDGIDWCEARLGWLADWAPVTFVRGESPLANLFRVASARRLILTNSTFSYWGGYISTVLHGAASEVWAPRFHARNVRQGRAYQLHPAWRIIEDIPGGWDS